MESPPGKSAAFEQASPSGGRPGIPGRFHAWKVCIFSFFEQKGLHPWARKFLASGNTHDRISPHDPAYEVRMSFSVRSTGKLERVMRVHAPSGNKIAVAVRGRRCIGRFRSKRPRASCKGKDLSVRGGMISGRFAKVGSS